MGCSLSSSIVYGIEFGSNESGWKGVPEVAYSLAWPGWVALDDGNEEDPGPEDFVTQCEDRLAANLDSGTGSLDFHLHGVSDWTEWVLGFEVFDGDGSLSALDDLSGLAEHVRASKRNWDETLAKAVGILGLTFEDDGAEPRVMLLTGYY